MFRHLQRVVLVVALAGTVNSAWAFALLGPYDTWQTSAIGYALSGDIGGPMALGEGYRWPFATITYGFDPSFMHWFGPQGSNAVVQAMNVLNNLPPASKMSATLSEYPTDTTKANYTASALGLADLKSAVLGFMMEQIGLSSGERYAWTLRAKTPVAGSPNTFLYVVIQRNFDPVTLAPSPFVNGVLYTYGVIDPIPLSGGGSFADAIEFPLDPDAIAFTSVSDWAELIEGGGSTSLDFFTDGYFYTGLTRDDVGGIRYLYLNSKNNAYVQSLPANASVSTSFGGSAWSPVPGTNTTSTTGTGTTTGTNTIVVVNDGLRPGVDKLKFVPVQFSDVYGSFVAFTNYYTDEYFTNDFHVAKQAVARPITEPDIIFSAGDLGLDASGEPYLSSRSAPAFQNNAALNYIAAGGNYPSAGPGQINPSANISFSKLTPSILNETGDGMSQAVNEGTVTVWASYDATTNAPIVYPAGLTIQELEYTIFGP
jgi:hypothetical protein